MSLVCPACKATLIRIGDQLDCHRCGLSYSIENEIADFLGGRYYDSFDPAVGVPEAHQTALELELEGTRRRVEGFYEPLIRKVLPGATRILDCGCGNGLAVDLLTDLGYDAWGADSSALRKWQWNQRAHRDHLVIADATALPFPDGWFDTVISSGVIEHIGVDETAVPRYAVKPRPDRDAERRRYIGELLRVTASEGRVFIDCPNGSFPIDFWHGDSAGGARFHRRDEGFLPSAGELRRLVTSVNPLARVRFLSPSGRLHFQQVRRHWYGRLLAIPAEELLRLMRIKPFRWLASAPLNPFLVAEIADYSKVSRAAEAPRNGGDSQQ